MKTTLLLVTKNNAMSQEQLGLLKKDLEAAGYEVITSFLSGLSSPMTDVRIEALPIKKKRGWLAMNPWFEPAD